MKLTFVTLPMHSSSLSSVASRSADVSTPFDNFPDIGHLKRLAGATARLSLDDAKETERLLHGYVMWLYTKTLLFRARVHACLFTDTVLDAERKYAEAKATQVQKDSAMRVITKALLRARALVMPVCASMGYPLLVALRTRPQLQASIRSRLHVMFETSCGVDKAAHPMANYMPQDVAPASLVRDAAQEDREAYLKTLGILPAMLADVVYNVCGENPETDRHLVRTYPITVRTMRAYVIDTAFACLEPPNPLRIAGVPYVEDPETDSDEDASMEVPDDEVESDDEGRKKFEELDRQGLTRAAIQREQKRQQEEEEDFDMAAFVDQQNATTYLTKAQKLKAEGGEAYRAYRDHQNELARARRAKRRAAELAAKDAKDPKPAASSAAEAATKPPVAASASSTDVKKVAETKAPTPPVDVKAHEPAAPTKPKAAQPQAPPVVRKAHKAATVPVKPKAAKPAASVVDAKAHKPATVPAKSKAPPKPTSDSKANKPAKSKAPPKPATDAKAPPKTKALPQHAKPEAPKPNAVKRHRITPTQVLPAAAAAAAPPPAEKPIIIDQDAIPLNELYKNVPCRVVGAPNLQEPIPAGPAIPLVSQEFLADPDLDAASKALVLALAQEDQDPDVKLVDILQHPAPAPAALKP